MSDDEELEEDLLGAKIILSDVSTSSKFFIKKFQKWRILYFLVFLIADLIRPDGNLLEDFYADCKYNSDN